MQTVYFLPGLGADHRVFEQLDLSFCNPVFIDWIKPLPREAIHDYARRLLNLIPDKNPVIVGLSFGGMIGVEMAKISPVKKLVLLSSAKGAAEIPGPLRMLRYLPLHKLFSPAMLRTANQFAYRAMGISQRADKIIFTRMLAEADNDFIRWALHQIIHWRNSTIVPNLVHIHGTADLMLPYRFIKADHTVAGGEHLMLMVQPRIVSQLLREVIEAVAG